MTAYQPLRGELSVEERWFVDLVAPMGFDWTQTRQELAYRFGMGRYRDLVDAVRLPPSGAISNAPLAFSVYAEPALMDLPPQYLVADFMPYPWAWLNHRRIEAQLRARLGAPVVEDTSNCIARAWKFGVFRVTLHTFPPWRQDRALERTIEYQKRHPRVAVASSISIESEYAYVYPDGTLTSVADLIRAAGPEGERHAVSRFTSPQLRGAHVWRRPSLRYSRRNPRALVDALPPYLPVAWVEASGRIGISMPDESLTFDRTPDCRLVRLRIEPGRGAGRWELLFQSPVDQACLFEGSDEGCVDVAAQLLSELWSLPIVQASGVDD